MADSQGILQSTMDVIGFLLLSVLYIIRSLFNFILPAAYEPVKTVKGEIVLITGGGSGLGRLLAGRLSKLGATIVVWDVNENGMQETEKMIKADGGKIYSYKIDITKREEVYKLADQVRKDVGDVSILINNAGVVSGYLFLDIPDHLIQRTFEVNAISHFWTTKAFLPNMIKNKNGHIVTIASMAGQIGCKKLVDYCASKFAAVGFDEALRIELEALNIEGVKTTVVCPFFIQSTGMFNDVVSRFSPTLKLEDVGDRVVTGILREDITVMIPRDMRYTLWLKWVMPWPCVSMYMRNTVPDACPTPGMT